MLVWWCPLWLVSNAHLGKMDDISVVAALCVENEGWTKS